jgi:polyisoprenoid-binding protein YceI
MINKVRKIIMILLKIDPVHSEVNSNVKRLVVSNVQRHFDNFDATV